MAKCGRPSMGIILWPGSEPLPVCNYHKEGILKLARFMGWNVVFNTGDYGPCESNDSHPDDQKETEDVRTQ